MYINDLDDIVLSSDSLKFADDTEVFSIFDPNTVYHLHSLLKDDLCLSLSTVNFGA